MVWLFQVRYLDYDKPRKSCIEHTEIFADYENFKSAYCEHVFENFIAYYDDDIRFNEKDRIFFMDEQDHVYSYKFNYYIKDEYKYDYVVLEHLANRYINNSSNEFSYLVSEENVK